eukprot:scaffold124273_cov17-Tisochrysis_lutea.AAC.1
MRYHAPTHFQKECSFMWHASSHHAGQIPVFVHGDVVPAQYYSGTAVSDASHCAVLWTLTLLFGKPRFPCRLFANTDLEFGNLVKQQSTDPPRIRRVRNATL